MFPPKFSFSGLDYFQEELVCLVYFEIMSIPSRFHVCHHELVHGDQSVSMCRPELLVLAHSRHGSAVELLCFLGTPVASMDATKVVHRF